MKERIQELHRMILAMFPDAVAVKVFVNAEGIEVDSKYRTHTTGFAMRTITGKWVKQGTGEPQHVLQKAYSEERVQKALEHVESMMDDDEAEWTPEERAGGRTALNMFLRNLYSND